MARILSTGSAPGGEVFLLSRPYQRPVHEIIEPPEIGVTATSENREVHAAELATYTFYGPLELLESAFSNLFLSLDPRDHESQIQLILFYRSQLQSWNGQNLLDAAGLPICGDGNLETGEQCDDHNTQSGDGCASYCAVE